MKRNRVTGRILDSLYAEFNRRKYVHPDPLEFLYRYGNPGDREVAGLIASCLAYGRVEQILNSVEKILSKLGKSPRRFIMRAGRHSLSRLFEGFRHRFTTGQEVVSLLCGTKKTIGKFGSLNKCFLAGLKSGNGSTEKALAFFSRELGCCSRYLVPSPEHGSACKRLNLYLRWMVRKDAVDPGGWRGVKPSQLLVPLDVHMAYIARQAGFSRRKSADLKMAVEVTDAFRKFAPSDPVKYDFCLTRFGIRRDLVRKHLLDKFVG